MINQPPRNGSCSIAPSNGTTSTLFTVLCPDWFDEDGIKDYSVYGKHRIRGSLDATSSSSFYVLEVWSEDVSQRSMVAFTPAPRSHLRLPAGSDNTSSVRVIVQIRDTLNCITQYNLTQTARCSRHIGHQLIGRCFSNHHCHSHQQQPHHPVAGWWQFQHRGTNTHIAVAGLQRDEHSQRSMGCVK